MLGALRHRNYRLYFVGQLISLVGTWMQNVALPWLALQLTHSGFFVGLVLAAQFLPFLLFGPIGGLIADRYPKRRILLITNVLLIGPAGALFVLTYTHSAQYWMLVAAAVAAGFVNLVDNPTRQAFVVEMVGREDLLNAIALNSTVFQASGVIGPAFAGVLIAVFGLPVCFGVNALSFLGAIGTLAMMSNLPVLLKRADQGSAMQRIREGFAYARNDPVVGPLLLVVAVFSLFAMNRLTLFPLFADQVLRVGAGGFGFLLGALGLGAVVGALSLAFFQTRMANSSNQFLLGVAWGALLLGFSFSPWFWFSCFLLLLAGFSQVAFLAMTNSRIQTATPDHLRGRVMALYSQALMGVGPIGSMQAGILATLFSPQVAMAFGAVVAGSFVFWTRLASPRVFAAEAGPKAITRWRAAGGGPRPGRGQRP